MEVALGRGTEKKPDCHLSYMPQALNGSELIASPSNIFFYEIQSNIFIFPLFFYYIFPSDYLDKMKVVTANFITCAVKDCKSFPLHFRDAKLELQELDFQAEFIQNIIPRLDWDKLQITANEVS